MHNPYYYFNGDTVISFTKDNLEQLLKESEKEARNKLLQDVKEKLGFSKNISFDDIAPIVDQWRKDSEYLNRLGAQGKDYPNPTHPDAPPIVRG